MNVKKKLVVQKIEPIIKVNVYQNQVFMINQNNQLVKNVIILVKLVQNQLKDFQKEMLVLHVTKKTKEN